MNTVGRVMLLVGALVLALLIGVLIGRSQRVQPASEQAATGVPITTAPPAALTPQPLPAPTPQPAAAPKLAPDQQVQEDAAAVGMTTREPADEGNASAGNSAAGASAAPNQTGADVDSSPPQPVG